MKNRMMAVAVFVFFCLFAESSEGRCFVAAIAMNQYDLKNPDALNTYAEQFAMAFQENAKSQFESVQTRTVLGRKATRDTILDTVNWITQNAGPKDFAAVYIGCHGGTDLKDGWRIATIDGKEVSGKELKLAATKMRCHVLFVIDTCGAGGFARNHTKDVALPPNAVAICSSKAGQWTTNHLTIALNEALWGQADFNHDGKVDLEELMRYVRLRAAELEDNLQERPVLVRGEYVPLNTALVETSQKQVAALVENKWQLGIVLKKQGATCSVQLAGSASPVEVASSDIFKLRPNEPQPVLLNVQGRMAPALLVREDENGCLVRCVYAENRPEIEVAKSLVTRLFAADAGRQLKP
jgi:hypothetical protein